MTEKLNTLTKILTEYAKFSKQTTKAYARQVKKNELEDENYNDYFIIIWDNHVIKPLKTKLIPNKDIDIIINRYRSRLSYKQNSI